MAAAAQHQPDLTPKKPGRPATPRRRVLILGVILFGVGGALLAILLVATLLNGFGGAVALLAAWLTPTPSASPSATVTLTLTAAPTHTATPQPTDTTTPPPTALLTPTPLPPTSTPTPLPTPDSQPREFYIPILMYHYVSVPPADADVYRVDLSVTPGSFRDQMAWLRDNGYTTISLYDLIYALNIGWPPLPDKPVVLTFDDGYVDNYENAFPILREFGHTATFFVLTDVTERAQPGYMTWDMLREMHEAGMDIEVHGREHLSMAGQGHDWLVYHLLGPAEAIEVRLGYRPRFLAYPSGQYDQDVIFTARQIGYWGAVTTVHGMQQNKQRSFELERLRIRGSYSLPVFAALVRGS
jgi:peptidoglycan/xylan/chitin deacetylase (PgdA/CDA1 family)